ncbi:hypothetical protein PPGU19_020980 [Paraburkholderia sp. PGU19]|nr:hypothetical protein PPGU19_020980 [Paraburkholderia sp. PGU19]
MFGGRVVSAACATGLNASHPDTAAESAVTSLRLSMCLRGMVFFSIDCSCWLWVLHLNISCESEAAGGDADGIPICFVFERADDGPVLLSRLEAAGDLPQPWARMRMKLPDPRA